MAYEDRYKDFVQYLTSGEPGVEERVRNWVCSGISLEYKQSLFLSYRNT